MTQEPGTTNGGGGDAQLAGLLDRQLSLYQDLEAMSDRQAQAIEGGDTDALLRVLSGRQRIIARINELVAEARPLFADARQAKAPGVQERLAALEAVVSRIAEADERDRATLEASRDVVASQLSVVTSGRKAVSAYGSRATGPTYQDRRG